MTATSARSSASDLQLQLETTSPQAVTAWGIPLRRTTEDGIPTDDAPMVFRKARTGELIRVRPGVFAPAGPWNEASRDDRFCASVAGLALTSRTEPVFCRETALLLYGLPLVNRPAIMTLRASSTSVAGTRQRTKPKGASRPLFGERRISVPRAWSCLSAAQHYPFRHSLLPGFSLILEDLRLCLADTLPRLPWEDAIVVADALLSGLRSTSPNVPAAMNDAMATPWTVQELTSLANSCTTQKAARRLHRIAAFASPLSGSPGESWSRVVIDRLGFEPPELQHQVRAADGRLLGILDFWWEGLRLAGEFDGKKKYAGRSSYSGRDVDPVILEEKRRSERIQEEGIRFVRWMWDDLTSPRRLEAKLLRAGVPRR
ncbi:hypothetical protein F7P69_11800 [Cellulosimicrobium funkei]|nr:hypothetical protein [Cellulosimicrobium funkei]